MHFEDDQTFFDTERTGWNARAIPNEPLPLELAFLRHDEIDCTALAIAARSARDVNACPASVLIADRHLSAARYYRALARHLDLDFIDGWPEIASVTDVGSAHALGQVELTHASPARWLVAPRDQDLRRLLSEVRARPPPNLAITTPAHLASIIHFRSQATIERAASDALSDESPRLTARNIFGGRRGLIAAAALLGCAIAMILAPRAASIATGVLFFLSISFRLVVATYGFGPQGDPPRKLADADLPTYTVLVPLRDEGDILSDLLVALDAIDYPRAKLEVLVLIEPEDERTRRALARACLPPWLHVVVGPWGGDLRTKPRALNIGLLMARGALLTVFDAEDRPDPNQLRLAAATFAQAPTSVACLQARLAIDNGAGSLLARLFALEYSFLFDILNVAIGKLGFPMALGGTSNHFRTAILREVGGWDAWNVTEDADLGLRLARLGLDVVCLPSTTFEVAPEHLGAWMKQRRRWLKGWMQTFLVLARGMPGLLGELGVVRSAALALLLANLVVGPLLFPILSGYVVFRLVCSGISTPANLWEVGEATIEAAVVLLGLASTLWCGYVGLRARKLTAFLPSLPLILPYQLMISAAAWMGCLDLILRPHHWHKTGHAARRRAATPAVGEHT